MAHVPGVLCEMKVCILIPVYNEANTISAIVRALREKSFDVVVVDDGSTDDSGRIAEQEGACVIRHEHKKGKGSSLQSGFDYILKQGYEGIMVMDGDGQHAVEDIDQFIALAQKDKSSIIVGNRMGNPQGMPLVRFLTNRFMSSLISLACKQSIEDTQCGFRYISGDILKGLRLKSSDFEIETEILIKASKKGCRIHSVPVQTIYRDEESKIRPIKDTIRFIIYFTKEIFS